jgi:6-pyruvoyltetrahydropterin/6-carboxytetrahydropterin synthase
MGRPRYGITKTIEFCYGHRLLNHQGKCCHLHGHNGLVEIDIEADSLDALGMVVDFSEIKQALKTWIDDNLDHQMLLYSKDPLVSFLSQMGEPVYIMEENPTAENIAKLIYHQAQKQGFKVTEVRLWETSSSYASYRELD